MVKVENFVDVNDIVGYVQNLIVDDVEWVVVVVNKVKMVWRKLMGVEWG